MTLLDDATRRVVYGAFSFREGSIEFEYGLRHVLLAHGRIGKAFVDNGSAFVSGETLRILSILGIPLIHSRVGYPASRGKVERFFRTVRDQFLRPLDKPSVRSLADLNTRFHTWLESEYHRAPHRGLGGRSPLEASSEAGSPHHSPGPHRGPGCGLPPRGAPPGLRGLYLHPGRHPLRGAGGAERL